MAAERDCGIYRYEVRTAIGGRKSLNEWGNRGGRLFLLLCLNGDRRDGRPRVWVRHGHELVDIRPPLVAFVAGDSLSDFTSIEVHGTTLDAPRTTERTREAPLFEVFLCLFHLHCPASF